MSKGLVVHPTQRIEEVLRETEADSWKKLRIRAKGFQHPKYAYVESDALKRQHRSAIIYVGFDFKITPDGEVKLIEGNGRNSGVDGYSKAYARNYVRENILKYILDNGILNIDELIVVKKSRQEEMGILANNLGFTFIPYRGENPVKQALESILGMYAPVLDDRKKPLGIQDGEERSVVWNNDSHQLFLNEERFYMINPVVFDRVLKHKPTTNLVFQDTALGKSNWHVVQLSETEYIRQFVEGYESDYIVLKPVEGSRSQGIRIMHKDTVLSGKEDLASLLDVKPEEEVLMEEFIECEPIPCEKDGSKPYDGCMRYTILAVANDNDITINHFGGYWRLASAPLNMQGNTKIATLKTNVEQRATDEQLSMVEAAVDQAVPDVIKKILRLPVYMKPEKDSAGKNVQPEVYFNL